MEAKPSNVASIDPPGQRKPKDPLDVAIQTIEKAKIVIADNEDAEMRSAIAGPVLKIAIKQITAVYEQYKKPRQSKQ